ncbi:MAG TPA: hypothetical protein VFR55_07080 [Dehalococcoidia bacterium]|nr:hypothetical protein [Dehalococcoidia bacterium]
MQILTEDAMLVCKHELGVVINNPTQGLVTVEGRRVLVANSPEGRMITGCPNVGATIKPCMLTLVVQKGYSDWIRIDGHPVCLDTVIGLTDGTPPGTVEYQVKQPGQRFVSEAP